MNTARRRPMAKACPAPRRPGEGEQPGRRVGENHRPHRRTARLSLPACAANELGAAKAGDETFKTLTGLHRRRLLPEHHPLPAHARIHRTKRRGGRPQRRHLGDRIRPRQGAASSTRKREPTLTQLGSEGSGQVQFKGIGGIAANSKGDVYVTDSGNARVQELGPSGEYIRSFGSNALHGGQLLDPTAIAIDGSGNVWVLNPVGASGDRIVEFSALKEQN